MTALDLDRLAVTVKARRLALHPSRKAAAVVAGISKDTWLRVETGQPVRDGTYVKIDSALEWATGSCAAITEGGDPVPVALTGDHDAMMSTVPTSWLASEVGRAVQDSAMATTPDLTVRQIRELSDAVVAELTKKGILPNTD